MKLLFVHQNFPGQYGHLSGHFAADRRNKVAAIVNETNLRPPLVPKGVAVATYKLKRVASPQTHHYLRGLEGHVRVGQEAARVAMAIKSKGFTPDVICAHPGWGESLYLKDVFPDARIVCFWEFFYRARGADVGFDPEYPAALDDQFRVRTKNATQLLALESADWGVSPTQWQWSGYPAAHRSRISVIHDGVDTNHVTPKSDTILTLPDGACFTAEDEVLTYVARNLEPYRGVHIFLRALPEILRRRPKARVIIVGGDGVSYGRSLPEGETYRGKLLAELGDKLDHSRLHFTGRVPYDMFLDVLRVSTAHVYLTYPFVLSWSLIEAMAASCCIIASDTAPVVEAVRDGVEGRLTGFFDGAALTEKICAALENRAAQREMRERARRSAAERYDLKTVCLPAHVRLIEQLARGETPAAGPGAPA